jgi:hypothetical protein
MFRAYGSFPNGGASETKTSLRNPLENIQTWGASPIAPPPTPSPSTTSSSSPDFHNASQTTQPNITNQRHNALRQLQQQSHFQNNLHAHSQQQHQQQQQSHQQQQQQQQKSSQNFFIEAALNNNNNNNNNNGFKNSDLKGRDSFFFSFFMLPSPIIAQSCQTERKEMEKPRKFVLHSSLPARLSAYLTYQLFFICLSS